MIWNYNGVFQLESNWRNVLVLNTFWRLTDLYENLTVDTRQSCPRVALRTGFLLYKMDINGVLPNEYQITKCFCNA